MAPKRKLPSAVGRGSSHASSVVSASAQRAAGIRGQGGSKRSGHTDRTRSRTRRTASAHSSTKTSDDTVVALGDVFECACCRSRSDCVEWGRTVKMRNPPPQAGHTDQPLGDACLAHWSVYRRIAEHMPFNMFAELYTTDASFAKEVDTAAETIEDENPPVRFKREQVTTARSHMLVVESPPFYLVTEKQAAALCQTKEYKKWPTCNIPKADGTDGYDQMYMLRDETERPFPKARVVRTEGANQEKLHMAYVDHRYERQGTMCFHHDSGELASGGWDHFWQDKAPLMSDYCEVPDCDSDSGSLVAGRPSGSAQSATAARKAAAGPLTPRAGPVASVTPDSKTRRPGLSAVGAMAPCDGLAAVAGVKRRRVLSAGSAVSADRGPPRRKSSGNTGSADDVDADDSASQTGLAELEGNEEGDSRSKTDYWIDRNDLISILVGEALGVAEYQANLRLRAMVEFDAKNPHHKRYVMDVAKLQVACAKKLRPCSIFALNSEELLVAIHGLGSDFQYPAATQSLLLTKRIKDLRDAAFAKGARGEWGALLTVLTPVADEQKSAFDPKAPCFGNIRMESPSHEAHMLGTELVDGVVVALCKLCDGNGKSGKAMLSRVCEKALLIFENLWEVFSDEVTSVVRDVVIGCRVLGWIAGDPVLGDEELFEDLRAVCKAATDDPASWLGMIGASMHASESLGFRAELLRQREKNNLVAAPAFQAWEEALGSHPETAMTEDHFRVLSTGCGMLVQWSGKVVDGALEHFSALARKRLLALADLVLRIYDEADNGVKGMTECPSVDLQRSLIKVLETATVFFSLDTELVQKKFDVQTRLSQACHDGSIQNMLATMDKLTSAGLGNFGAADLGKFAAQHAAYISELTSSIEAARGLTVEGQQLQTVTVFCNDVLAYIERYLPEKVGEEFLDALGWLDWLNIRAFVEQCAFLKIVVALQQDAQCEVHYDRALQMKRRQEQLEIKMQEVLKVMPHFEPSETVQGVMTTVQTMITKAFKDELASKQQAAEEEKQKPIGFDWKGDLGKTATLKQVLDAYRANPPNTKDIDQALSRLAQVIKEVEEVVTATQAEFDVHTWAAGFDAKVRQLSLIRLEVEAIFASSMDDREEARKRFIPAMQKALARSVHTKDLPVTSVRKAAESLLQFRR